MSKQESGGDDVWAAFLDDREPGGVRMQEAVPAGVVDGSEPVAPGEPAGAVGPVWSEPAWPADDPAAGTMPDDAWLTRLFAEGEALLGERDGQHEPSAVPGRGRGHWHGQEPGSVCVIFFAMAPGVVVL
ncbi:hypothetical protein, partial [Promicromonospora sukumoe]|uniref:hypothetical protein n=1 Tax=Promicromonospora sukumoe TaxID=88382 RepID=UPI0036520B66